jgi:hypothetical protein
VTTSATSGVIIEVDDPTLVGQDRRRAMAVAFTLCLAVGSAFVGRDTPLAISEIRTQSAQPATLGSGDDPKWRVAPLVIAFPDTLSLPANTTDVQLQVFPDWLANEQLPPMHFELVRVRAASGLAVEAIRAGDPRIVMWTERGTVYWLVSDRRDIADLVRLADTLR